MGPRKSYSLFTVLMIILFGLCFWLTGCVSILPSTDGDSVKLDNKYYPLTRLKQDSTLKIDNDTIVTDYATAFVKNLSEFLGETPQDSVRFQAVLLHEQYHSKRQFEVGERYKTLYLNERLFRWAEEREGWRIQIRYLQQNGNAREKPDVKLIANFLAFNPTYNSMVEYDYAIKWVQSVIDGKDLQ